MSDELNPDRNEFLLNLAVRSETAEDEQIVWSGRADAESMALPLLPFPVCWLSGMFLLSMGVLHNTTNDTNNMIPAMAFLLVVVAVMGILEIISVPWQARRSIYVVTDRRSFILKLRGRFGNSTMTDYTRISRKLVRPEKGTLLTFFCYTVPIHACFLIVLGNLVLSVSKQSDPFIIAGVALIVIGWIYQWYSDFRYPLPQFRECPRAFYFFNEWLAAVETVPHESVDRSVLRKRKSGVGDLFILARGRGCMRMKSVPGVQAAYDALSEQLKKLSGEPTGNS